MIFSASIGVYNRKGLFNRLGGTFYIRFTPRPPRIIIWIFETVSIGASFFPDEFELSFLVCNDILMHIYHHIPWRDPFCRTLFVPNNRVNVV